MLEYGYDDCDDDFGFDFSFDEGDPSEKVAESPEHVYVNDGCNWFTGTSVDIDVSGGVSSKNGRYDICVTDCDSTAARYADEASDSHGGKARVYAVQIKVMPHELHEILPVLEEAGIEIDMDQPYWVLDRADVQELLVKNGVHAVAHWDHHRGGDAHKTVRFFTPGCFEIVSTDWDI